METPVSDKPIDTAPLQRVIDMFVLMAAKVLEGALDKKALARLKKIHLKIERVNREMKGLALHNMRAAALARLRADVDFRARVRDELGGFHVIKAWREKLRGASFPFQIELRKRRAEYRAALKANPEMGFTCGSEAERFNGAPNPAPPEHCEVSPERPHAPHDRKSVRTDSSGLFRLAPVPAWLDSHIVLPRSAGQGVLGRPKGSRNKPSSRLCAPIPLMPDDLDIAPRSAPAPKGKAPAKEARDPFSNSQRLSKRERRDWQWDEAGQDYFPPDLVRAEPPPLPPPPMTLPPRVRCL